MDGGTEAITDPVDLMRIRRQARAVHFKALVIAVAFTVLLLVWYQYSDWEETGCPRPPATARSATSKSPRRMSAARPTSITRSSAGRSAPAGTESSPSTTAWGR